MLIGRDMSREPASACFEITIQMYSIHMYSKHLCARWIMRSQVWFISIEISFYWNSRSSTFSWDKYMAFSTVILLVLALLMSSKKQSNSGINARWVYIYVLIYESLDYSRESELLLPCLYANSSEFVVHRMICSRYAIIIDLKWRRRWWMNDVWKSEWFILSFHNFYSQRS